MNLRAGATSLGSSDIRPDERSGLDSARSRFTALYDAHSRALLAYSLRRTDPSHAADIVAETFLVAWRRLYDVPPRTDVRPWLFGVARRVLANHRRGDLRRSALAARLATMLVESTVLPDEPDDMKAVHDALGRLSGDDRELITLVSWDGLTPSELAVVFDVPAATVRTRLHRARNRLRAELTADDPGNEREGFDGHVRSDGHPPIGPGKEQP